MNWWVHGCLLAAFAVVVVFLIVVDTLKRPPYNHVLTTVERVDEDADALRVYHDKVRGATCYETYGIFFSHLSCVPDIWLTPKGAPLP